MNGNFLLAGRDYSEVVIIMLNAADQICRRLH
jgi:hypothetical protein